MRILRYEWKKLCGFRLLWILLLCLICLNGYIQISTAHQREFTPDTYRQVIQQVNARRPEQAEKFLEKAAEDCFAARDGAPDYDRLAAVYEVQELFRLIRDYPEYLANIDTQAAQTSGLAIWGGKDTFSYRNIKKTPPAYQAMKQVSLRLDTELGLSDALCHPVTDFLGIFLLFLIVSTVMLKDREQGMMPLLFSMPDGRGSLLTSKLVLIALCSAGTVLLLYGENLLIGASMYGLGDLSRPIQCASVFYECNLPVSAGTYLVMFAAAKIAAFLVFSMAFAAICAVSRTNLAVWISAGTFCAACFLLYQFVPQLSDWSLFHYLSPMQLVRVNDIIGTYKNINLFGYPVSLKLTALLTVPVCLAAAVCVTARAFVSRRNQQYRNVMLRLLNRKKHRVHGPMFYVLFRSLILQKGIVPVLAVIFAAAVFSSGFVRSYTTEDIYYEKFTTNQAGPVTDETYRFIIEKQADYFMLEKEIRKLQQSGENNTIRLTELSQKMNDRSALELFRARYNAIRKSRADGEMFYDSGYARLFGLDGNSDDLIINLCILIFLCMLLSPYASQDKKTDMVKILYASSAGRRGYWKQLLLYSAFCGVAVSLIFNVPYIWHILHRYGTQGLSAPLQSMTAFSQSGVIRSVRTEIIILFLVRIFSAAVTAMLISLLAGRFRSTITAYIVNISMFVLPAALALMGIRAMRYFGVNPFLSYHVLVSNVPAM